ncbi:hypothetical protein MHK_007401 [Candidatus Magnetomorum sp. HK-1]|nr:hypothetical protein MHK_007401 [Candidatus Magnetomorum sp. HK-1]
MNISRQTINRLKKEQSKIIQSIIVELLNDKNPSKIQENIDWIEASAKIINLSRFNYVNILWAGFYFIFSITIFVLLCSFHIPQTEISLNIVSKSVTIKNLPHWQMREQIKLQEFSINNLQKFSIQSIYEEFNKDYGNHNFHMALKGKINLKDLTISDNTIITFSKKNDIVNVYAKNSKISGKLSVRCLIDINFLDAHKNQDEHLNIDMFECNNTQDSPPVFITFETIKTTPNTPLSINLKMVDNIKWNRLNISDINFLEEYPIGSGKFESTIKSASINILNSDKNINLKENDNVFLSDLVTKRMEIITVNDGFKVSLYGSVSKIEAGPTDFEKDLSPTLLTYLIIQHKQKCFWTVIIFLWGALWKARAVYQATKI